MASIPAALGASAVIHPSLVLPGVMEDVFTPGGEVGELWVQEGRASRCFGKMVW